ncbi:MAG TPA: hypothetical protein VK249_09795 [Anaerolineales bacterium]|nr:hypothetical protein [Anaerolineales bacterium]
MRNKKLIFILGILVVVVGGAAFVAGRLLNQKVGPAGPGGPIGSNGGSFSVQLVPAKELPKAAPDLTGQFVERKDNTIIVASAPPETGGGGVVTNNSSESDGPGGPSTSSENVPSGPKVEVVVTSETKIYRDTTKPPSGSGGTVQETVGEGTLDDLNADSMLRVWGRKSGDRIVADILFYSSPLAFKRPAP